MYFLELANHQKWNLIADPSCESWLSKLARLMKLESDGDKKHPNLIFVMKNGHRHDPIENAVRLVDKKWPVTGWHSHPLRTVKIISHPETTDVICEINRLQDDSFDIATMWSALYPIYRETQNKGGFGMHSALIEFEGTGYLLAGKGGSGKSTCCQNLFSPWRALCDDETLIVTDDGRRYFAHPMPTWSDFLFTDSSNSWNTQYAVPLKAVFFLKKSDTTAISFLGKAQTAALLHASATQIARRYWLETDKKRKRKIQVQLFDNACELSKSVPAFILNLSKKTPFCQEIEKVAKSFSGGLTQGAL